MKYFYITIVILINFLISNVKTQFDPITGELIIHDTLNVKNHIQFDPITGKSIMYDILNTQNPIANYTVKDLTKSQKKQYNKNKIVIRRINKGYFATLLSDGNGWEASHVSFILFHTRIENEDFFKLAGLTELAALARENRKLRNRYLPLATACIYLPTLLAETSQDNAELGSPNYEKISAGYRLFQIGGMVGAFYFIYDYSMKKSDLPTFEQASTIADQYNNNLIQTIIGK